MSRRRVALEILAVSALSAGAVVLFKSLWGGGRQGVSTVRQAFDPEEFSVAYSTHGSEYRFPGSEHNVPQPPFKTFGEALNTAQKFVESSQAIEGRAKIVNVKTGSEQSVEV